jgi:hypothetical protein
LNPPSIGAGRAARERSFDGADQARRRFNACNPRLEGRFRPLNAADDSNAPIADIFAAFDSRPATPGESQIAHRGARRLGLLRSQSSLVAEMHGNGPFSAAEQPIGRRPGTVQRQC